MDVPGYTEIRELGHGGTGRVMLALRLSDGSPVAIKHLSARLRADERFVERFRAEAELIREIDSPHIARLLDYTEADDDAVIVMELVDGVTLRRLLESEGATGPEAALTVLKGSLLGLAEAHRQGVVHRDFKPENVIVSPDGFSKLVDFGVAARSGETAALAGTPSYMAPEQWQNAPAGPLTDVYAAAVVLFECLTGHRPFPGANVAALAYQHQHLPPPLGDVEEQLRPLVAHGLAKDPAERPPSVEAFLAELEQTADTAYGAGWETRGKAGLGLLAVPLAALLPSVGPPTSNGTSLFHNTLAPVTKRVITGGLVVATAAAVVSAFVVWSDYTPDGAVGALPPGTSAPAPASPSRTAEPSATTPTPSPSMTLRPASPPPTGTDTPRPTSTGQRPTPSGTDQPPPTRATRHPTVRPSDRPTDRPTDRRTTRPSTRPTTRPTDTPTRSEPTRSSNPPATKPPPDDQPTGSPTTAAPPAKVARPLISVSVEVSLDVPVLSGKGDSLLDAHLGLGLGTGLLGIVAVPGSLLLGRRFAVRRVKRDRDNDLT